MVLLCLVQVCHFAVEKGVLTEPQEPFPSAHGPLFFGGNNSLQGLISHEDTGSVRWVFMFGCFVC